METAADIAKKYGLEYYLDRPEELNSMIFRLLLLQESIQVEQSRKIRVNAAVLSVRRSVLGKFVISCSGDRMYRYAVETALKAGTAIIPMLHTQRFVRLLGKMGVPSDAITDYCSSLSISDDTHCADQE